MFLYHKVDSHATIAYSCDFSQDIIIEFNTSESQFDIMQRSINMLDTNYSKLRIAEPLGSKIVIGDNMYFPDNYKTVCDLLDAVDMDIQNKNLETSFDDIIIK